jgi:hypothetical protein
MYRLWQFYPVARTCVVAKLRTKMERECGRRMELMGDKYKANAAA